MWWHDRATSEAARAADRSIPSALCRLASIVSIAALCAGCFQPLYGDRPNDGKPGLSETLSAVKVNPIDVPNGSGRARLAVELRNQLIFDLTGGGGTLSPTHELTVKLNTGNSSIIVDPTSQRPEAESFSIDVVYELKDLATGKVVVRSSTVARASHDTPGGEQRFVRFRGQRDSENRAAKVVADQIRNRLASYFVAGT
jgi:LPS-assembly lipoprotein